MNGPPDLPRLRSSSASGSALAAGLTAARMREPSEAQLRALDAALADSLGAASATGHAGVPRPEAPALASAGMLKVTLVLVALAGATGGVVALRHRRHVSAVTPPAPMVAVGPPRPADPPAPSPALVAPAGPGEAAVAPRLGRPDRVTTVPHPRHDGDELALIARAQRALDRQPAAALGLIENNQRLLARSAFAQEAEVIAVAALARLGRTDEARQRASRFLATFPDSVHASRMQRLVRGEAAAPQ